MSAYSQGQKDGQKNPNAQTKTPQQMPNAAEREKYNAGLKNGQGK